MGREVHTQFYLPDLKTEAGWETTLVDEWIILEEKSKKYA